MGLDMYAFQRRGALDKPVDFDCRESDEEIFYWRKHPDLHGWMHRLYARKGGQSEQSARDFNGANVEITAADLDRLEQDVGRSLLPPTTGFFFGASLPDRADDDREFIAKARAAIAAGYAVYYTSSW